MTSSDPQAPKPGPRVSRILTWIGVATLVFGSMAGLFRVIDDAGRSATNAFETLAGFFDNDERERLTRPSAENWLDEPFGQTDGRPR